MFKIGSRKINKNNFPYLIAEIGVNHNGSIHIAKKLIDSAKKAGFDTKILRISSFWTAQIK